MKVFLFFLTQVVTYENPLSKFVILNEVKELHKLNCLICCKIARDSVGNGSFVDP